MEHGVDVCLLGSLRMHLGPSLELSRLHVHASFLHGNLQVRKTGLRLCASVFMRC